MDITKVLMDDHLLITNVLACLEKAAEKLENGQEIKLDYFSDIVKFLKIYIVNIHQKAEETVLFDAMVSYGLSKKDKLLTIAILEHEQSQLYIRRLNAAIDRWRSGNTNASRDVIRNAIGFINLLRQHIRDEENKLYPKAKKIIPVPEQLAVKESYDRFMYNFSDRNIREKYMQLISVMESEFS